ncbi:unnamed protein product [Amoebophrya sp. A25]|nr:unnamed protein product [Amoebophrya sp. A25]|eukprot:GSA25T00007133001.1
MKPPAPMMPPTAGGQRPMPTAPPTTGSPFGSGGMSMPSAGGPMGGGGMPMPSAPGGMGAPAAAPQAAQPQQARQPQAAPASASGSGGSSSSAVNSASSGPPAQPIFDKQRDQFIAPYPLLGLECCENGRHAISCGGGGSAGKKEIPNEIHLHAIDNTNRDKSKRFVTLDRLNMGSVLPTKVTYSPEADLWCVSAGARGYIIEVTPEEKMKVLFDFQSETKKVYNRYTRKDEDGIQEFMKLTANRIFTVGSDGAKVWSYPQFSEQPLAEFTAHTKPIEALDVSPDGRLAVTTSEDRTCKIWKVDTAEEFCSFSWNEEGGRQDPMNLKFPHFFTEDTLLLSAAGPRGPAMLGLWKFDVSPPKLVFPVQVDAKPCSALRLNRDRTMMMCGFVPGHKNMYSVDVDSFKKGFMPFKKVKTCGTAKNPIHALQVQCVAFSAPTTALSASGDYTVHLGPSVATASSSSGSGEAGKRGCCCWLLTFFALSSLFFGSFFGFGYYQLSRMTWEEIRGYEHWVTKHVAERKFQADEVVRRELDNAFPADPSNNPSASGGTSREPSYNDNYKAAIDQVDTDDSHLLPEEDDVELPPEGEGGEGEDALEGKNQLEPGEGEEDYLDYHDPPEQDPEVVDLVDPAPNGEEEDAVGILAEHMQTEDPAAIRRAAMEANRGNAPPPKQPAQYQEYQYAADADVVSKRTEL